MTDQTTPEPVAAAPCDPSPAPCCKCAAYREIINEQAATIAKYKKGAQEYAKWAKWITDGLTVITEGKP